LCTTTPPSCPLLSPSPLSSVLYPLSLHDALPICLDVASRQQLAERLASLHQSGITLVLVLNRFDEIPEFVQFAGVLADCTLAETDRKSTRLNSSHVSISYAVFCLKKKRSRPKSER